MSENQKYWLVGANWSGEDQANAFFRRGYWELGWGDNDQPGMASSRDAMKPGDRVAIKSMLGQGSSNILIKALGIIKEVGDDKRIYIDWKVTDLSREVQSHGCYSSIHGPYSLESDGDWIRKVFLL